ncbi:DUF1992 domain-containing protein [Actinotalea sp. M2MS4P-6]|uniref:DnaJ family domain-containing protein n=1 Tax=Actinotalea sp. M2MS4P-6 TaxID=2983762 RepID=UPI0021E39904|nr:DUF1992 domain-containing protein [Actinotalea sp. M2MS4P-6]MCV2396008.1 DUF1992 domain-containing protein [Actinotalea sp. M2MS4P-6]
MTDRSTDPHLDAVRYRADRDSGTLPHALPDDRADRAAQEGPTEAEIAAARAARIEQRALWVDRVIDQAIERGDFDHNPYAGRPLPGINGRHDPDWWLKGLIEREHITGVLPEALQLRKDDAALDDRLDALRNADEVRREVADFNRRVIEARRQLLGGPPVITDTRDAEAEVAAWVRRRSGRDR